MLLKRGARLPTHVEIEVAPEPGRAEIRILLCRGEEPKAADNTFLGALTFMPVASSAAVSARAKVKIMVTSDGLLSVSALHPLSGEHKELDLLLSNT